MLAAEEENAKNAKNAEDGRVDAANGERVVVVKLAEDAALLGAGALLGAAVLLGAGADGAEENVNY